MKRKELLAALKDRIQPLENSEAGLLCGGFTEIGHATVQGGSNNNVCVNNKMCDHNDLCNNNSTCANNDTCKSNNVCIDPPTKSAGDEVLDYSTIF